MSKEEAIKLRGVVRESFPNSKFAVDICNDEGEPLGHEITATISGKLRMNLIKILRGDKVDVEVSPYDLTNGRIVWRYK